MSKALRNAGSLLLLTISAAFFCAAAPQTNQPPPSANSNDESAHNVPSIDGAAGPCSLELTVTGADKKPVYAANVKVHIAYRVGGFHKLDLEASTNVDGKVKFLGLPARVRRPPLNFQVSRNELSEMLTYDPETECQASRYITLAVSKPH